MIRSFPLHTRTWARGIITTYGFNSSGDLSSVDYGDSTPDVTRTYRRDGSPATVTDAAGTTTYAYSGANSIGESVTGPGLLAGLTLSHPQSQGRRQSFTATLGGATVSAMGYGYDTRGRLASVSESGIGFTGEFGYASNSDLPATTVSKAGATTVLTGTRTYDNADRLASIGYARPGNLTVTSHAYTLDAADRRTRADREDGTAWVYGYNERDEVTSAVKQLENNNPLAGWQQEFSYDNLGNRKFTREGGDSNGTNRRQLDYATNALNQYTQISHPNAFDVLGRAPSDVSVTVNGAAVTRQGEFWRKELGGLPNAFAAVWQPVQVDAVDPVAGPNGTNLTARRSGHRYLPKAVETPFYDLDGNLVSDARWTYVWNGENQLIEMSTAAPALAAGVPKERYRFVYDSRSRRIARTVEAWNAGTQAWTLVTSERFVYDDWNVVAVVNATGQVVQRYVWGNDLSGTPQGAGGVGGLLAAKDTASGRSWCYAYDGNGNVSAVVDLADGAKVGRYDYDAFGRMIATWGDDGLAGLNPYRFSTKPWEGTGLYYYGFRWLNAETTRWLSVDPIGEDGGVNLYGFVSNRPVVTIDILGLEKPDLIYELTRNWRNEYGTYGTLKMIVNNPKIEVCCGAPTTYITMELPPKAKKWKGIHEIEEKRYYTGLFSDTTGNLTLRDWTVLKDGTKAPTTVSPNAMGATLAHKPANLTPEEWEDVAKEGLFINGSTGIAIHKGTAPNQSGGCVLPGTRLVPVRTRLHDNDIFREVPSKEMTYPRDFIVDGFEEQDSLRAHVYLTYYVWCAKNKAGAKGSLEFSRVGDVVAPIRAIPVEEPPSQTSPDRGKRRFFPNIRNPIMR